MEINKDARVYDNKMVVIVEIMGRHAGWLAASAALATAYGSGPYLIYLPECDFDMDQFLADVDALYKKNGKVFVRSGAGIVADSDPEKEYQECLNKAKASLKALELAQEADI